MSKPTGTSLGWKPAPRPTPVTLHGRTVALQPLNAERHAEAAWAALGGHEALWAYMLDGPFTTESELRQAIERKQNATDMVFEAIVPAATGVAEGWASYLRFDPNHGVIEVGNIMLAPRLQRTTAATEAMFLMTRHVFEDLGYRRYEWKCNAENLPSRSAALRLGFTFEGIFRRHMVVKDRNRDTAWFAMIDSEWPARKRAFEAWLDPRNFDAEGRQRRSLTSFMAETAS